MGVTLVLSESKKLRIGSMTVFYFAQGLPIGLFLTGIAAWLADNGMAAGTVAAIVAMVYLPWSFKFIGAALMDRYTYLPMGRRRIWLIASQLTMLGGLGVAAVMAPTPEQFSLLSWLGFLIFCGSAMQDVAVDGLAVDILPEEEQGMASAFMFGGQALGMAIGAALGGYLLEHYGSAIAFLAFTPLNLGFLLLALAVRERPGEKLLPWTRGQASPVSRETHGVDWLQILHITFKSMIGRDSLFMLGASALGRAAGGIFTAFWPVFATTQAGYSTSSYSNLYAVTGLLGSVACIGVGSLLVGRLGPRLASIVTYSGYALIGLVYLVSPEIGAIGYIFVILTIGWNMTETLTLICSNPLRMRLCDRRVAATQFTIYNSLGNLPVAFGALIFAWAMGAGGIALLMPISIAMIVLCGIGFGLMRIGGRPARLIELTPQIA